MKYLIIAIPIVIMVACTNNTPPPVAYMEAQNHRSIVMDTGKILFEAKCATCHGSDGTAGIGNAANLKTSQLDSIAITDRIRNGQGGMPAFKGKLSDAEIHKLESYVYRLRK